MFKRKFPKFLKNGFEANYKFGFRNIKLLVLALLLLQLGFYNPAFADNKLKYSKQNKEKKTEEQKAGQVTDNQGENNKSKHEAPINSNSPVLLKADNIEYDQQQNLVIATGDVEVTQENRTLLADKLTYDKESNIVTANGHVSLLEPNGTKLYADMVVLSDNLKKGVVDKLGARFPDNSLLVAKTAVRKDENKLVMRNAVYSPCPLCKDDKTKPPLWQVKAKKATINTEKERVYYNNAFFDIYGVPVLYTPYFSHPTPGASRKTGFLTPKYTHDQLFGTTIKAPFYYNIAENKDLVLTPIFTQLEGSIIHADYRHLLASGEYNVKFSATNPDKVNETGGKVPGKNEVRAHIEGKGDFKLNEEWAWGFDAKRASDDTYLNKYHFGDEDVLTSKAYTSRVYDRNHLLVNAITFQGLKADDDPGKTPLVLPYSEMHMEKKVGEYNTSALLDANVLALARDEGVSSRRLSVKTGLVQPYLTNSGNVFSASMTVRADGYAVDNVPNTGPSSNLQDGAAGRVIPEADLKWSLPMVKHGAQRQYLIEPTARLIVSPYGGNPNKIPNEDSQDIEFSSANLFDSSHYTGYDLVESGPRVNYGIKGGLSDFKYGDVNFVLGQNYRARADKNLTPETGLSDNFSDYVGKISYNKSDKFDLNYRFRFDKDSLTVRNNSVGSTVNYKPVKFSLDYLAINKNSEASTVEAGENNREIMIASTNIDITDDIEFAANGNRNIASGDWISTKAGVIYKFSCVDFSIEWLKEFTRDRDIEPSTSVSFQISLKNMGFNRDNDK